MNSKRNIIVSFLFATLVLLGTSCSDPWDDSVKVETATLKGNLLDAISVNPNLTEFHKILKETGYDVVLGSDNNYTVLAPDNQALAAYATASVEVKKELVRNHIATLTYNAEALAGMENLVMLNGKNLLLTLIQLKSTEVLCDNGILREASNTVLPRASIFDYLRSVSEEYDMAKAILAAGDSVMDMNKSQQTGVDPLTGKPVYDTVYMYVNTYLNKVAIQNEDSVYTLVLLDNENFTTLKTKYGRYTKQYDTPTAKEPNPVLTDSVASEELLKDLAFRSGNDEGDTFTSITGVEVNMSGATTQEVLASNGRVLIASGVDIRIRDNKVKEVYIQGEDYLETTDDAYTYVRLRDYAMGGKDVMVAGRTVVSRDSIFFNEETQKKDTVRARQYTYMYNTSYSTRYSKAINFYLKYMEKLYSVKYNVYWVTYDDIPAHSAGDQYDPDYDLENLNNPCPSVYRVSQKLYISKAGEPQLRYNGGIIENKMIVSNCVMMVGYDPAQAESRTPAIGVNAGVLQEQPLRWHRGSGDYNAISTPLASTATRDIFDARSMGYATFFVTNSPSAADAKATDNGMIFLDYIRLVPVFDEDE